MALKKIVFVIVEGPSDDTALGLLLNRIYDSNTVHVEIMHSDITTNSGVAPSNIVSKLGTIVKSYADNNYLKKADFQEVIHLVDTDGAYIPDSAIQAEPTATKPLYTTTNILTCNKSGLEFRNQVKRTNLNRLIATNKVWGVPYRVFYMSCNLDHALYNKLNSDDSEKENDAYKFVKVYKDHIPEFIEFICRSDFSEISGYKDSWTYIKQGLHSLERHTNLGICLLEAQTQS